MSFAAAMSNGKLLHSVIIWVVGIRRWMAHYTFELERMITSGKDDEVNEANHCEQIYGYKASGKMLSEQIGSDVISLPVWHFLLMLRRLWGMSSLEIWNEQHDSARVCCYNIVMIGVPNGHSTFNFSAYCSSISSFYCFHFFFYMDRERGVCLRLHLRRPSKRLSGSRLRSCESQTEGVP